MFLVVDIGNTNITIGLYKNDEIVETFRLLSDKKLTVAEYEESFIKILNGIKISACVIGSVVDELNEIVKQACDNVFGIESFLFTTKSKTGVVLDVEKPETVGADRIANAYAVYKKYTYPCIVVDLGSATTFDIISSEGKFFGGIIMPGINMQLNSLFEKTSKLAKFEPEEISKAIGYDTKTCILSGVIRGQACAIDGLISQCEEEIGEKISVVLTGGLSSLVSKYMKREVDYFNPNLTLDGFKFLYELNNGK